MLHRPVETARLFGNCDTLLKRLTFPSSEKAIVPKLSPNLLPAQFQLAWLGLFRYNIATLHKLLLDGVLHDRLQKSVGLGLTEQPLAQQSDTAQETSTQQHKTGRFRRRACGRRYVKRTTARIATTCLSETHIKAGRVR